MRFFKNIRLKAALFFFRKRAKKTKRKKNIIRFSNVKSVALLFETKEPQIPFEVEQFTQKLVGEEKKVYHIIFYSGNSKALEIKVNDTRIIFTRKDLGFFFNPPAQTIARFNALNVDYVIDLNFNDSFPLIYLAGISKAPLRVGKHSEMRLPHFDLMINGQTENLQEFTQDLLHYLKILNPHCHE